MKFIQVRQAVLSGEHQYAYLKFKRTIVRISKANKIDPHKFANPGGLLWEINQKKNSNVFDYSGWEEIRQQASYMFRDDWEFHDHP